MLQFGVCHIGRRFVMGPISASAASVRSRSAFTLIEVLVVVAIIALLIAILLPALSLARSQAKVTICAANSKQIATSIALYQSTDKGFVPIMLNWHAGPVYGAPARAVFLSVALRQGEKSLAGLAGRLSSTGQKFDPNQTWSLNTRDDYEARFLPAHFVCPFERGKEPWDLQKVGMGPGLISRWEWSGVMESYQTWLWEDIIQGKQVHSEAYGWGGPLDGLPKYSALSWNQIRMTGKSPGDPQILNELHRKWQDQDSRRLKAGGLSSLTTVYCAIGEHMEMGNRRIDVGSHRMGAAGGTNAIFADSHVEWVLGTRIGWP
jgi:prepilin-type N-terminal cleavage/methylation domain-containing protein